MPLLDPQTNLPIQPISGSQFQNAGNELDGLLNVLNERIAEADAKEETRQIAAAKVQESTDTLIQMERDLLPAQVETVRTSADVARAELSEQAQQSQFINDQLANLQDAVSRTATDIARREDRIERLRNIAEGRTADGQEQNPLMGIADFFTGRRARAISAMRQEEKVLEANYARKATMYSLQSQMLDNYPKLLALTTQEEVEALSNNIDATAKLAEGRTIQASETAVRNYLVEQEGFDAESVNNAMKFVNIAQANASNYSNLLSVGLQHQQLMLQYMQRQDATGENPELLAAQEAFKNDFTSATALHNESTGRNLNADYLFRGLQGESPEFVAYAQANMADISAINSFLTSADQQKIFETVGGINNLTTNQVMEMVSGSFFGGASYLDDSNEGKAIRWAAQKAWSDYEAMVAGNPLLQGQGPQSMEEFFGDASNLERVKVIAASFAPAMSESPQLAVEFTGHEVSMGHLFHGEILPEVQRLVTTHPRIASPLINGIIQSYEKIEGVPTPDIEGVRVMTAVRETAETFVNGAYAEFLEKNPNPTAPQIAAFVRQITEDAQAAVPNQAAMLVALYKKQAQELGQRAGTPINNWPARGRHNGVFMSEVNMLEPVEVERMVLRQFSLQLSRSTADLTNRPIRYVGGN